MMHHVLAEGSNQVSAVGGSVSAILSTALVVILKYLETKKSNDDK